MKKINFSFPIFLFRILSFALANDYYKSVLTNHLQVQITLTIFLIHISALDNQQSQMNLPKSSINYQLPYSHNGNKQILLVIPYY